MKIRKKIKDNHEQKPLRNGGSSLHRVFVTSAIQLQLYVSVRENVKFFCNRIKKLWKHLRERINEKKTKATTLGTQY